MESKKVELFNKLSFGTLLGTIFLSLLFFIPYISVTLDASKGFLVSVGMTLALFFWLIARLGEGKFSIPKDKLIMYAAIIPVVFLVASFFSSSQYTSLFGSGFEIGTFGSMFVLFILFFLSSIYFQTEKRIVYFYMSLFVGGILLAIFELIHIFIGFGRIAPRLLLGVSSGNLIGSWNDFALFFGLLILLSLLTLEFLRSKKVFRIMQFFILIVGLFFLIIINIPFVWLLVGLCAAIIFIYSISIQQTHAHIEKKKFPFISLIVVFICFIFLVGSNSLGGVVAQYVNVPRIDIRPSFTTTAQIAWKAIKHNPLFGTGPNTFIIDWSLWQPKDIAQGIFWNTDFVSGFSTLSTFVVTTGILGLIAFALFIVTYCMRSYVSLKVALQSNSSNYFTMATLVISTYSWVSLIFYTPNIIMIVLAFASSGMLVGMLVMNQHVKVSHISFLNDPRNSFFAILGIMVLMMITLSTTYVYAEKFASIIYFSKGSVATNTLESLSRSETMLTRAIALDKNDIYYRTLSQVYVGEIQLLVTDKTLSQDTLKSNVQQLVSAAEGSALAAVNRNPKGYLNYVNLGDIYASFVPFGIDKSYESAIGAYEKARTLAPNNASVVLSRASLEYAHKNNDEAKKYIQQALDLKVNYTDALFLLAQIETSEGNAGEAIKQAERAAQLTPTDATIFFRLGLLRYGNSDYTGAVSAFEQAVILNTNYLNARYFLGQAYQKVGRTSDALIQFKILAKVLPENQDIKDAIASLYAPEVTTTPTTKAPAAKTIKAPLPEKR